MRSVVDPKTSPFTGHKGAKAYRENQLKEHKHLWDDLEPKYGFGCKRVLMSEQYYAAMARPNVHIHSSHIDKIVNRTIYTKDGSTDEVDVSENYFNDSPPESTPSIIF